MSAAGGAGASAAVGRPPALARARAWPAALGNGFAGRLGRLLALGLRTAGRAFRK